MGMGLDRKILKCDWDGAGWENIQILAEMGLDEKTLKCEWHGAGWENTEM